MAAGKMLDLLEAVLKSAPDETSALLQGVCSNEREDFGIYISGVSA